MVKKVFRNGALDHDTDAVSVETGLRCEEESLALQAPRDEVDINTIVRRFGVTGQVPIPEHLPSYADFGDVLDFRTAQDAVLRAKRSFEALDPKLRQRFGNDPQVFLEFCSNEENREEMVKLGLAQARAGGDGAHAGGSGASGSASDGVAPQT